MISKKSSVLGGALLVAGSAIGGGILALPVLTALGGFPFALVLFTLCWLFMAGTGYLMVEVCLWNPQEVNLVSMAEMTLGKKGKAIAWFLYLYLFSSLMVAYVAGSGEILATLLDLPPKLGPLLFVALFFPFIVMGPWIVDRLNRFLMMGLIGCFVVFLAAGLTKIDGQLLVHSNLKEALLATPIIFTSFGFQGLVPTLTHYLNRDRKKTLQAILLGSFIPLVIYLLWEALILGIIPLPILLQAKQLGYTAVTPLKNVLNAPWLYTIGQTFAFLTLLTSFLGVALALIDFLADGFNIQKTLKTRMGLTALITLPPLFFALSNPCLFLNALHYGGGLGCALLLGVMPILMVLKGQKQWGKRVYQPLLWLMLFFISLIILSIFWYQSAS